jgi:TolB-like protein/Flp pilus assembly protein TadD
MSFFEELKRRNVFRVGIAYLVTAWLLLQVADIVLDNSPAPGWVMHVIMLLLAIGFPLALLFAWAFEMTPEGLKKEKDVDRSQSITHATGRRLDFVIIGVLAVALGYFAWDKFSTNNDVIPANAGIQTESSESAGVDQPGGELPPAGPPEKSIAVLPFVNMSNDPDQEYFSDGISEELLNVLAKYPGVRVAARTSSFQFKGKNQDIGEIARLLKVRNVLEGSVRKSGSKLRITAQLIQADTGYHLWSATYDRELDDVFAIQDEISAAIGEALRVELALGTSEATELPRVAESANTAAYEAFLRGRHLVNQRGRSNITQAVEDLKRAVRLDPGFAPAHAWMAIGWIMMLHSPTTYGDLTLAEVNERAQPHIARAFELDPDLPEVHAARGLLAMNTLDFGAALGDFERALELNPVYVDAMNWSQIAASNYGEYAKSLEVMQRMLEVDPLSIVGRLNYAPTLAFFDREAAREMTTALAGQNAWAGYTARGNVESIPGGSLPEALGWYMRAYGADPHDEFTNRLIIRILAMVGEFEEARRISDANLFIVDLQQGKLESAIGDLQAAHQADPENYAPMTDLADALHLARRFDESRRLYLRVQSFSPVKLILDTVDASTRPLVRLAYDYQLSGEAENSEAAIAVHRADLRKRMDVSTVGPADHVAEAMARAVEDDNAGVFESLRTAIDLGLRDRTVFGEPCFDSIAQHPEFLTLKSEVATRVEADHQSIVELICHNNPIPEMWQPLRETCESGRAGP